MCGTITTLLSGTTRRVTFHNINLGVGWILGGTVGEFAWKTAARKGAFTDSFASLTSRFTSASCVQGLFDQTFGGLWVGLEIILELLAGDLLDDAIDFAIGEFGLGLTLEAWFWYFNRNSRR